MNNIKETFTSPSLFWAKVVIRLNRMFPGLFSEKAMVSAFFRRDMGYSLDWDNPQTYNEKLNWVKIYDQNPLYTTLVDKIEVKKYVDDVLGEGYTFPVYGIWEKPEDINFDELPNEFVLKCNHNSAVGLTICKDKANGVIFKGKRDDDSNMSYEQVREWLQEGLDQEHYSSHIEWAYKNVKRRIFAEKFMSNGDGSDLSDYKFFCFNGEPKFVWVGTNYNPTHFDILTIDWENQNVEYGYTCSPTPLEKPEGYEEMVEIARKLSKGIPHVRIDLYNIDGKIYFGEFTFYTWGGIVPFNPTSFDKTMGEYFELPKKK